MMRSMRKKQGGFTLLEMLIVILVIAAMATQFLPNIMMSEVFINTNASDYNQMSALRYIEMYQSLNEKYPAALHTGLATDAATANTMPNMTLDCAIAYHDQTALGDFVTGAAQAEIIWDGVNRWPWEVNYANAAATSRSDSLALTAIGATPVANTAANSLAKAGIVMLAYGANNVQLTANARCVKAWPENTNISRGYRYVESGTPTEIDPAAIVTVTLAGQTLAQLNPALTNDVIIPLWVGPEVVWDYYYNFTGTDAASPLYTSAAGTGADPDPDDASTWSGQSRVGMSLPPRNPKMSKGSWSYYMCLFLVDCHTAAANSSKATPARLLGVLSPELTALIP